MTRPNFRQMVETFMEGVGEDVTLSPGYVEGELRAAYKLGVKNERERQAKFMDATHEALKCPNGRVGCQACR